MVSLRKLLLLETITEFMIAKLQHDYYISISHWFQTAEMYSNVIICILSIRRKSIILIPLLDILDGFKILIHRKETLVIILFRDNYEWQVFIREPCIIFK